MSLMNAASSVSPASSLSRSRQHRGWRRRAAWLRFGVGPLALAGFFLPWATGPGPYSATEFTGFTLVGFAGRLQALDLSLAAGGVLLAVRLAILGVAIAAVWQTFLAPRHHGHLGYPLSGWYLAASAALCLSIGFARSGWTVPPFGLACLAAAGACFVAGWFARRGAAPG
jgi:hypothetical protein